MTQKLHGLIEYTASKFGHVADHSVSASLVRRSQFPTSEDPTELSLSSVLEPHSAHLPMPSFSMGSGHERVDSKVFLQGIGKALGARANAVTPTNRRIHHLWRELMLVTPQQG